MSERVVVAKAGIWQKVNGELTCVWEVQGKPLVCSDGSLVVQRWTNGHVFWGNTGRWSIEANTTPNDLFKWVCPLPSGESYSEQILGLNKQVLECKRERDKANDEIDRLNEECSRLANAKSQSEALRIEQGQTIQRLQADLKSQVDDLDIRLSQLRQVNEIQQRERVAAEKALMGVVKLLAKENCK